jgi:hypothetical protein
MGQVELNLVVRPAAPADLSQVGDSFATDPTLSMIVVTPARL